MHSLYDNEMKLEFTSKSSNEAFARIAVAAFAAQLDPTIEELADIKTAVSEAVTNCIIHGYEEKEGIIIDMINTMYESEIGKSIFIYSQVDEDYKFIGKVKDISVEIDTLRQHPMVNVSYHLDDETCIILEKLNDSLYRFDFYYNEDLDIDENDKESGFNYKEFYKMKEFGYKYNIIEDLVDTASFFIKEECCIIK